MSETASVKMFSSQITQITQIWVAFPTSPSAPLRLCVKMFLEQEG